jgi:hypothetical protein
LWICSGRVDEGLGRELRIVGGVVDDDVDETQLQYEEKFS